MKEGRYYDKCIWSQVSSFISYLDETWALQVLDNSETELYKWSDYSDFYALTPLNSAKAPLKQRVDSVSNRYSHQNWFSQVYSVFTPI